MTAIDLSATRKAKHLAKARRDQHLIGLDDFTDAELIGGAFCDGIDHGVEPLALHAAYFASSGAADFEARVWAEIYALPEHERRVSYEWQEIGNDDAPPTP
ncbi:hypothetical protein [Pararhodobacter sp. CCB-MM2]|uniref:hypothetical protein n=1 Tax=Pararhodobacter sp. CCB-MM2 TaxID=1786003 RepID=UPI000832983A|nr:hypothetical protein [Pararhodobacter sp. CCB-MM2]